MQSSWIQPAIYIVGILVFGRLALYSAALMRNKNKTTALTGCLLMVFTAIAGVSYFAAWSEQDVLTAFEEWFATGTLLFTMSIGAVIAGSFCGTKIYAKTSKKWLGWLTGIFIAFTISIFSYQLSQKPQISCRIDKIFHGAYNPLKL